MARRRLIPTPPIPKGGARPSAASTQAAATGRAPIAQIAGGLASQAALEEVGATLEAARAEGRLIQALPLDAVAEDHLVRDRLPVAGGEDMDALVESLRRGGQRTPIEVVELGDGRYGLISGWRRLMALRRLAAEGGPDRGQGVVLALVRAPANAAEAYRAMVEENEIRADLSYWERARIVARAAAAGAYPDEEAALDGLFGAASRAKRSKIRSFGALSGLLGEALPFPAALSERAGLALLRVLRARPDLPSRLRAELRRDPPADPAAQAARIDALLSEAVPPAAASPETAPPAPSDVPSDAQSPVPAPPGPKAAASAPGRPDVALRIERGRIILEGPGAADPAFLDRLSRWLDRGG